jgi:ADP-ribosylglycohydrolase
MLGAICGDVIGSRHELSPIKTTAFELLHPDCGFTDDTVMSIAVCEALLDDKPIGDTLAEWVRRYPYAGYGGTFLRWAFRPPEKRTPYGSWGNGSAMRVGAVAWLARDLADTARLAAATAAPTHNHHHGVRGAKATAVAVRMALEGWTKDEIAAVITDRYGYDLLTPVDTIRPLYNLQVACQDSIPQAFRCFIEAGSFEETVRLCVSLGGDADTQAAIAGAVAEAHFGIPDAITGAVSRMLPDDIRSVMARFQAAVRGRSYPKSELASIAVDRPGDVGPG